MRNTLMWVFVLTQLALITPHQAGAQALGNIEVNSYLNQSLNARINVTPAEAGEFDKSHIGLAAESDFEKAGIKHSAVLDQIKFKLVKGADGKQVIELTTQAPIKEPLLDFILEVTLPNGRLTREYNVMLDPQFTTRETASAGQTSLMGNETAPQQVMKTSAPSAVIPTRSIEPKLTDEGYGPTMRPNTLWEIAEAMSSDKSVSVPQMMLAIVMKNPDAFYNNNVNALKAGYFLRIPGKDLINQISEADADKEVKRQYQQWLQSKN